MRAIDVHGHFGPYDRGLKTRVDEFMSAGIDVVSRRAAAMDIRLTIVSAIHGLIPYRGDAIRGNEDAVRAAEAHDNIRFWTIIDPRVPETYEQADRLLEHPRCKGIKLHPHAQEYEIREHGDSLFAFAAGRAALVLTHSGDPGSFPEDFVPYANRHANVRLILAHLGNSPDDSISRQVDAIKVARHGNLFVDTSSSRSMFSGLIEWAVDEIGHDRILFGTDTPLYWAGAQKARIESAEIGVEAKEAILFRNAASLLNEEAALSIE